MYTTRLMIFCFLFGIGNTSVLAAEATPQSEPEVGADAQASQDAETASRNGSDQADVQLDGQEPEEESPSRFIPTEQISQDLGVSFPVDI
ncbi:MAG: hypothetical protein H7A04_12140 [Pseudomonadales bacterium]|nr:hypothetical protein [Pseudomonadales bacterium]MCP5347597.1 hypothetical protein [Pseudomonadales bacterium]